ncbi:unnamed protein product, partial [Effrenium voratum]
GEIEEGSKDRPTSARASREAAGHERGPAPCQGQVLRCAPWGLHGVPGEDGPRA